MRLHSGGVPSGGSTRAARQAAVLFVLSGLSAFAAMPTQPGRMGVLATIGVADLVTAAVAWLLPWHRWAPLLTAVLALPAFAVLALSTWAFGQFAAGTGPFFVLLFAWLGLHHRPWVIVANALPATVAYLAPLVVADASSMVLSSAVVLIPVAVGVGLVIARQVRDLREQRDHATRAESWRSALMATLAHDIRSPLTAVQGSLVLLDEIPELPIERRTALVSAALRQTKRLTRLATGLLDLERVEQGKLRLNHQWVSVATVVNNAAGLVATDTDVQVEVEHDQDVYADPERLEQVLVNLIANAVRHGRPPVVVTADGDASTVRIAVRDHGAGVPADRTGTLFGRLGGESADPDSVGLGMWIVRLLVEAHDGTVAYEPADPGARFTVSLPADGAQRLRCT